MLFSTKTFLTFPIRSHLELAEMGFSSDPDHARNMPIRPSHAKRDWADIPDSFSLFSRGVGFADRPLSYPKQRPFWPSPEKGIGWIFPIRYPCCGARWTIPSEFRWPRNPCVAILGVPGIARPNLPLAGHLATRASAVVWGESLRAKATARKRRWNRACPFAQDPVASSSSNVERSGIRSAAASRDLV